MAHDKVNRLSDDPIVSAVGMTKQLVERWEEEDAMDEALAGQPTAESAVQFDPEVVEMYKVLIESEYQKMLEDLARQSDHPKYTEKSAVQAQVGRG